MTDIASLAPRVLGFDLDGTIIDHSANKVRLARQYGYDLVPEQTSSGVMSRFVRPHIYQEIQARLYTDMETTLQSRLMPGAGEGLARIKASGSPYYLLTRRQPEVVVPLLKELGLWGPLFNLDNSAFVEEMRDKAPFARDWGVTHYVDDHISTLEGPLRFITNRYLFDPFKVLPAGRDYQKLHSWDEIMIHFLAKI